MIDETAVIALDDERAWLVRLCARMSGGDDAAEDLAQRTLVEAWRNGGKLTDPSGRRPWLAAIARNVCLRRGRERGRELPRAAPPVSSDAAPAEPRDDFDLAVELERAELATLLDRAMALLPPETRAVLVQRYVEESPVLEIAGRLGLSEGAVAMRLQRGKVGLRRVLLGELREEAASYGLVDGEEWQTTRIWCPVCGRRRLQGRFTRGHAELWLQCPDCTPPGAYGWHGVQPELREVRAFKPALTRFTRATAGVYLGFLGGPTVPCLWCGRHNPIRIGVPDDSPAPAHGEPVFRSRCSACGDRTESSLSGLVLALPEAERFWRDNPRIHRQSLRSIGEADGRAALAYTLASVGTGGRLEVVAAADTLRILSVHRAG